jgi:hypothetical protein
MTKKIIGIYTELIGGIEHGELIRTNQRRIYFEQFRNTSDIQERSDPFKPVTRNKIVYESKKFSFFVFGKIYSRFYFVHEAIKEDYLMYLIGNSFKKYLNPIYVKLQ